MRHFFVCFDLFNRHFFIVFFFLFINRLTFVFDDFPGTSSVARGLSVYLDALIDGKMSHFFHQILPMNVDFLAKYPDFFSFFVVLLLAVVLSAGVKESSIMNNIFTTINVATVVIVIASGIIKCEYFVCELGAVNRFN